MLAWVLREGATNVMRHSGASACRIELAERDGRLELTIADDGVGTPTARRSGSVASPGSATGWPRPGATSSSTARSTARLDGFRLVATVPGGGR